MVTGAEVNGLVVITQVEPISVVFSVPQDELPKIIRRISSGDKLPVKAFDRTQQNLLATGVLVSLDNLIDPTTGTIKLKAEFPNKDGQLFPNQFVNARLELESAWTALESSAEVVATQEKALELARESVSIAQVSYENGVITSAELNDAQVRLLQTEWLLMQAKYSRITAAARAKVAAGVSS